MSDSHERPALAAGIHSPSANFFSEGERMSAEGSGQWEVIEGGASPRARAERSTTRRVLLMGSIGAVLLAVVVWLTLDALDDLRDARRPPAATTPR